MDVVVDDSPCVTKSKCTTRGSSGVDRSPGLPERERGESGEGQRSERVLLLVIVADAKKQARARGHTTCAERAYNTHSVTPDSSFNTPPCPATGSRETGEEEGTFTLTRSDKGTFIRRSRR